MRLKFALILLSVFLLTGCLTAPNIGLGVTNLGWEEGDAGDWTFGGTSNPPIVVPVCRSVMIPRTGTYFNCFGTFSAFGESIFASFIVDNEIILDQIRGEEVTWNIWYQVKGEQSGSPGNRRIKIQDDAGEDETDFTSDNPPAGTYWEASVTRTIDASATFVKLRLEWLKVGGGGIVYMGVDDMTVPDVLISFVIHEFWPDFLGSLSIFALLIVGVIALIVMLVLFARFKVPVYVALAFLVMALLLLVTTGLLPPWTIILGLMIAFIVMFLIMSKSGGNNE